VTISPNELAALSPATLISLARETAPGSEAVALVIGAERAAVVRDDRGDAQHLIRADALTFLHSLLAPAGSGTLVSDRVPSDLSRWLADASDLLGLSPVSCGIRTLVTAEVTDKPERVRSLVLVHLGSGCSVGSLGLAGAAGSLVGGSPDEVVGEALAYLGLGPAR
jgi:hypothetical protein